VGVAVALAGGGIAATTALPMTPARAAETVPGSTVAVIVGVDHYRRGAVDLRSSVNDAESVDSALANAGVPPADRVFLRDNEASASEIRAALRELAQRATPTTTAVFFYAGHALRLGGDQQAILAADGVMITDIELSQLLAPAAGRMWIGMAACYGGGFTELLAPGRVLTAAADEESEAFENDKLGHSYLVDALIRHGLDGNFATRSIQDAFADGRARLAREHPDRLPVIVATNEQPLVVARPGPTNAVA
jgi:hypothetical protein